MMEVITQHPMFTYAVFFILGAIGSSAAFGIGFGAYLASKSLTGLAGGTKNVSRDEAAADPRAKQNEIQKKKESPCGKKCKYFAKHGGCDDKCALSAKLAAIEQITQSTQQAVSQAQPTSPELPGQSEIQQPVNAFLGGSSDCYAYCKLYNDTGKCDPNCPIVQSQQ